MVTGQHTPARKKKTYVWWKTFHELQFYVTFYTLLMRKSSQNIYCYCLYKVCIYIDLNRILWLNSSFRLSTQTQLSWLLGVNLPLEEMFQKQHLFWQSDVQVFMHPISQFGPGSSYTFGAGFLSSLRTSKSLKKARNFAGEKENVHLLKRIMRLMILALTGFDSNDSQTDRQTDWLANW